MIEGFSKFLKSKVTGLMENLNIMFQHIVGVG